MSTNLPARVGRLERRLELERRRHRALDEAIAAEVRRLGLSDAELAALIREVVEGGTHEPEEARRAAGAERPAEVYGL